MTSRRGTFRPTLAVAALLLGACRALAAGSLDGWWRSEGYGWIFHVGAENIAAYEVTSVSCLPTWTARREKAAAAARSARFADGFESGTERFEIVEGAKPESATLKRTENTGPIPLVRLAPPPRACEKPPENSPLSNYAVLWTTFSEHYPSFRAHKIDWDAVDRKFRARVRRDTGPDALFSLFEEMLAPLEDDHVLVEIFPPGTALVKAWEKEPTRIFQGRRPDPRPLSDSDRQKARRIVNASLDSPAAEYCQGKLRFGTIGSRVGYLEIDSFHGYAPDDDFAAGLSALQAAAAGIFQTAQGLDGLIIDIRHNGGGNDPYGLEIASHLTDRSYLAWAMQARSRPKDRTAYGVPSEVFVIPTSGPRFLGKVVLLLGRDSASAAETFAMALLGRSPRVLMIGENSQGVFSDVLDRRLPNGWRLVLPNQILVTAQGVSFDVTGVPPNVRVEIFPDEALRTGRDGAIQAALLRLRRAVGRDWQENFTHRGPMD